MSVVVVGLTGGIGSGKSTVGRLLAARGAHVIEADEVVHRLYSPDGALVVPIVQRFGSGLRAADGSIDRPALADIVFGDADARQDLEAIVHPAVGVELIQLRTRAEETAQRAGEEGSFEPVVLDIPLLAERGAEARELWRLDGIVVVDVPELMALSRLMKYRGMTAEQASARMDAQVSREERLAVADFVIDNSATIDALEAEITRCWTWLSELAVTGRPYDR